MIIKLKKFAADFAQGALSLLYPRVCPVCGEIISTQDTPPDFNSQHTWQNPYICRECYAELSFPEGVRCLICSRPIEDDMALICTGCSKQHHYFDRGAAVMMHDDKAKTILYDLKYSNRRDNADMLAAEAAEKYGELISFWDPQVIIPVPLHKKRQLERGFNQAELLADRLSAFLRLRGINIPSDRGVLKRTSRTSAQKNLGSRERRDNIRGAFELSPAALREEAYRRVLLLDDIYTSGATLSEAARVLKGKGTETVYFITFSIG